MSLKKIRNYINIIINKSIIFEFGKKKQKSN